MRVGDIVPAKVDVDEGTRTFSKSSKTQLCVEESSLDELSKIWASWAGAHVYQAAAELLLSLGHGGLVIIYDVKQGQKKGVRLPTTRFNDLVEVFSAHAPNIFKRGGDGSVCRCFSAIAHASTSAPAKGKFADKWAPHVVNELAAEVSKLTGKPLESVKPNILALEGKSADGTLVVMSLTGRVVAANCRVDLVSARKLCRPNGTVPATRHHAGLAAVEWLQCQADGVALEGVALVRSDAGSLTAIFVDQADGEVKAYQVDFPGPHDKPASPANAAPELPDQLARECPAAASPHDSPPVLGGIPGAGDIPPPAKNLGTIVNDDLAALQTSFGTGQEASAPTAAYETAQLSTPSEVGLAHSTDGSPASLRTDPASISNRGFLGLLSRLVRLILRLFRRIVLNFRHGFSYIRRF